MPSHYSLYENHSIKTGLKYISNFSKIYDLNTVGNFDAQKIIVKIWELKMASALRKL